MARLDEYIFGYSRGKVDSSDVCKLTNVFLRLGICTHIGACGDFTIRAKDVRRFSSYAKSKVRFALSEPLGVRGFIVRNRRKYGFFAALITVAVLFILTRGLVWDVRVSGNATVSDTAVLKTLGDYGLAVGSRWSAVDKNVLEATLLSTHPEIAWISVNRRGTVAYVELIESENIGKEEVSAPTYSNIVAQRDGVIEEIAVKSGEAMVKVGDVVRAGDVLISGVTDNEIGVRFCRAVGSVRAQSVTDVEVEISRSVSEKTEIKRRIAQVRVLLFNFSINIFKNYGNCENSCDIIEVTKEFALFGRYKLPFSLNTTYLSEYSESVCTLTDDEMVLTAKAELYELIQSQFRSADVIKLRTDGGFDGDVYRITTRVVYSSEVGKESAIEIN